MSGRKFGPQNIAAVDAPLIQATLAKSGYAIQSRRRQLAEKPACDLPPA
jgi:hypothetical protein